MLRGPGRSSLPLKSGSHRVPVSRQARDPLARPPLLAGSRAGAGASDMTKPRLSDPPHTTAPIGTIEAARAGDQDALEEVIRHYQQRVAALVFSLVGRNDDFEDLCQSIFVKMVLALPALRSAQVFEPWLFRIARNVCTDYLRRRRWLKLFVPFTSDHEAVAVERPQRATETVEAFAKALGRLPRPERELICLLCDREWSYEELGQITGSGVGAIKARLFRARRRLFKLMGRGENER